MLNNPQQPFSNPLLNSEFNVSQRGTTFASGAIAYGLDRWKHTRATASAGATFSQQAGFSGARFCYRLARDAANAVTDALFCAQQIETFDSFQFQGKSIYVGADLRAGANFSAAGSNLTCTVFTGTGTNETVNVATGFATGNTTFTQTQAIAAAAQRLTFGPFAIPAGATEIAVVWSWTPVGVAGANDYAEVTRVAFGNLFSAVNYTSCPYATEWNACQRYYEKSFNNTVTPAQNVGVTGACEWIYSLAGAVSNFYSVRFKVTKRATAPTITLFNPSAANAQVRDTSSNLDCSASAASGAGTEGFRVSATGNAGTVAGTLFSVHWTADSEIGP